MDMPKDKRADDTRQQRRDNKDKAMKGSGDDTLVLQSDQDDEEGKSQA